uniref:Uncharacterized protein n=1 Tax=Anguilla anguilla TaxID=7936 RepID=A0A0E9RDM2_ANGAN
MLLLKSSNRDINSHVMLILNRLLFVIMLIELIIVTEIEDLNYNKPRQAFTEKICSFTWLAYKCHSSLCKTKYGMEKYGGNVYR